MNCMVCGKPIPDDAVLCDDCMQAHTPRRRRRARSSTGLIVALCLSLAALIGTLTWVLVSSNSRAVERAKIRMEQEELYRSQATLSDSETAAAALREQIAELEADNAALRDQISALGTEIGKADNEKNQSTATHTQAIAELDAQIARLENQLNELTDENLQLSTANDELLETNDTLSSENDELKKDAELLGERYVSLQNELSAVNSRYELLVDALRDNDSSSAALNAQYLAYMQKSSFLDTYIVFVMQDGSKQYHTYDCPNFNSSTAWNAYNRSLARSLGYSACPKCG